MEKFVDRDYMSHLTVARVAIHLLLRIADTPVLPFNVVTAAYDMKVSFTALKGALEGKGSTLNNVSTSKCFYG